MLIRSRIILLPFILGLVMSGCQSPEATKDARVPVMPPEWVKDAVFYQIFPERFRNGDPSNDPVRSSMDYLEYVPEDWQVSRWTKDWYEVDPWERGKSPDVYDSMFDRRFGGDLQGVIDKLDYLQELGITAIWFNPVFAARSLHKYDANSFHHIDPHFGPDPEGDKAVMAQETSDPATWRWTSADRLFLRMVEEAHRRGIRIVLDGVWNHTGRGFFAFEDVRNHQEASIYGDWYDIHSFDDPTTDEDEFAYEGWFGYEALPEFANNETGTDLIQPVKEYIEHATARWMDPDGDGDPSDGIDGWRLDVAQDVPTGFWKDWNTMVRTINPQAYTVAEIWVPAADFISEAGFSGAMNYHAFAMPVKGFLIDGMQSATEFATNVSARMSAWSKGTAEAQLNVIDSHDTPRLASMVVNRVDGYRGGGNENDYDGGLLGPRSDSTYDIGPPDETDAAIMRITALFQMTFPGVPIIYYGTEAGMWGADDPDDRKPMLWPDLTYDSQKIGPFGEVRENQVGFDSEWYRYYQDLIDLHQEHEALRRGQITWMKRDSDEGKGLLVYDRFTEEDTIRVIINRGLMPAPLNPDWVKGMTSVFSTGAVGADSDKTLLESGDGHVHQQLAPLTGMTFTKR